MITSKLQQSASSNSLLINKSNRKFLVFSAFLLTLLLGSSSQLVSSYLPNYDRRAYQRALMGRKFFSQGKATKVRTQDFVHEAHHAEHAENYRDQALYCDRSHYRTDLCVASSGDVRVLGGTSHGRSYKVLVLAENGQERLEKLKPYTRKWEKSVMETIDEVMIIKKVIKHKVSLNRINSSAQDRLPVLGSHDLDTSTRLGSLQQDIGAMASFNQSAKLHRILIPQNIKLQQKERHNSSTQSHQKRQLHKSRRINDSKGSDQQHHLQEARRRSVNREDELKVGVQQEVKVRAVHPISGAELQGRRAAVERSNRADRWLPDCEVQHEVPAILFSTGGYTGNVYHEFNDGLIPLFITAQQYTAGKVVLVVLEYHGWWMRKYAEVVAQISNYTVIDLAHDKRVHCFPEVTIGLRIHDELAIHVENRDHASIAGFQSMLRAAYAPGLPKKAEKAAAIRSEATSTQKRPRLLLISRRSPRAMLNEGEVIALAKEIGFSVELLTPTPSMRMADIYKAVSRCDVMLGVHGAALTHLVFMRPGATLIQVVPLGTDWAAATYYGEPAQKLGLDYVAYKVRPTESSLWSKYARDDPVLVSPESVNQKGWWETKRIYLQAQDVTVSLPRMRVTLLSAYARAL